MWNNRWILGVAAIALGAAAAALIGSGTALSLMSQALIYALFATGVGLLLKQNGMVSFGHAMYFGGAGYLVALLLQTRAMPGELVILATLAIVAVFAFLLGLIVVRVPGIAFGMLTLAVGQMFYLTAARSRGSLGGADGINIEWPASLFGVPLATLSKPAGMFLASWITLVITLVLLSWVLSRRFGGITEAVRDNEERARFIGIRTLLPRAMLFALSGVVTALAGVLSALNTGFVSPENLHWSVSGVALMMVVVGGVRELWGPALGATVYFLAKDVLGDFASHWMAIFGIALIVVIVFWPHGMAGALLRLVGKGRAAPAARAGGH